MNKRVLIVTYYWPPSGGSGVQRWLKFVKYLGKEGWEPYVYTPENPSFTISDPSLLNDVPAEAEIFKLPIWEPYQLFYFFNRLFGKKQVQQMDLITTGKKSFAQKVAAWIRGNLLIPDARKFWVRPSVRFLSDIIKSNQIDIIITTGPPHSIHLIGLALKMKNPSLKWVVDFRDPWSEWDLLDTLSLSKWARSRHQKLEKRVLTTADRVITIAPYHVDRLESLSNRKVDLITNGFDEDDFPKVIKKRTSKFTIRHVGVVDELRDPRPFLSQLRALAQSNDDFRQHVQVEFVGQVNSTLKTEIEQDEILKPITVLRGQISHSELLGLYATTDLQLLVLAHTAIAPGNLPGKFFEYLASGNPIFGIGPTHGDAAHVLQATGAGVMIDRSDSEGIKRQLIHYYQKWKQNEMTVAGDVSLFSRRVLTKQLISLLNSL